MRPFLVWILITLSFLMAEQNSVAASPQGHWTGMADLNGDKIAMELDFEMNEEPVTGRWSLPELGYDGIPFQNVKFDPSTSSIAGDKTFITGTFDEDVVSGKLVWRRIEATFQLKRSSMPDLPYLEEQVSFVNGDVKLAGTLVLPRQPRRYPAIVFLHGSGSATRWGAMYYAVHFAKQGLATLIYDKRGSGASGGDWTQSSLDDLARDGLAAIQYLKSRKEIDAKKIGIWGISQAGWVASRLCSMTNDVSFMIMVSGGGVRPHDSEMFSYNTRFKHAAMTDTEKSEATVLLDQYFSYLKTGEKREALLGAIEAAKQKGWYQYVSLDRILPSQDGLVHWNWVARYDPAVDIQKIKFPVLLLFGENDTEQPVSLAVKAWEKGLTAAQNKDYRIRIFPEANHGIRSGSHEGGDQWPRFVEGYLDMQLKWLAERLNPK